MLTDIDQKIYLNKICWTHVFIFCVCKMSLRCEILELSCAVRVLWVRVKQCLF